MLSNLGRSAKPLTFEEALAVAVLWCGTLYFKPG
jgi:hypothetical protein